MSEKEIIETYDKGIEKIIEMFEQICKDTNYLKIEVLLLKELNKKQEAKIAELEAKLNINSSNSSLPPSSDRGGKKKINNREKSDKKIGGQEGHEGKTLEKIDSPDDIIEFKVSDMCDCGCDLLEVGSKKRTRQKFDIPTIKIIVTEYVTYEKTCPICGKIHRTEFPIDVTQPVEYGNNLKSLMNYFVNYQLIPVGRTAEAISDIVGQKISTGTIVNETKRFSNKIENVVLDIKQKIVDSDVVHFDETGLRSCGKTNWLHVASTETLTHYESHENRGNKATNEIGILPNFKGTAVHDHWKPYYKYSDCTHAECNSHNLRHCKNIIENYKQDWAEKMASLLIKINRKVKELKDQGNLELEQTELNKYYNLYHEIIKNGFIEDDKKSPKTYNKKGELKNSIPRRLLIKFKDYDIETLSFMYDFKIPFDNNLAERDIRMQKLRQKISGCFRGEENPKIFCKIRSYISTARKHGKSAMEAIKMAVRGTPFYPS
jgi:transposase